MLWVLPILHPNRVASPIDVCESIHTLLPSLAIHSIWLYPFWTIEIEVIASIVVIIICQYDFLGSCLLDNVPESRCSITTLMLNSYQCKLVS